LAYTNKKLNQTNLQAGEQLQYFLFFLAAITFYFGFEININAKSAIHEIEALLFFIMSAILVTGAAIIESIKRNIK